MDRHAHQAQDLDPLHVVAGHKQPDGTDDPTDIDESIQYLTDFNDAETRTTTPTDLYRAVLQEHPRRANPGSALGRSQDRQGRVARKPTGQRIPITAA